MKRDPIRMVGWCVFGVGAVVLLLTKPVADTRYQTSLIMWKRMSMGLDRWIPSPPDPNYAGGFIAGGFLAGFGMLVLGIRRALPTTAAGISTGPSNEKPRPDTIGAAVAVSLPKAMVAVIPPWERGTTDGLAEPTAPAQRTDLDVHERYPFRVVGESEFQPELESIASRCFDRGPIEASAKCQVTALIVPPDGAASDVRRTRVEIHGMTVGYLDDRDAGKTSAPARVRALIVGGWRRGSQDRGLYGVRLSSEPA
jgi:hypothetical protein